MMLRCGGKKKIQKIKQNFISKFCIFGGRGRGKEEGSRRGQTKRTRKQQNKRRHDSNVEVIFI